MVDARRPARMRSSHVGAQPRLLWVTLGALLRGLRARGDELLAVVFGVVASTLYFALGVALRGQTLGQWLLDIEVVDADGGGRVPFPRAALRSLALTIESVGAFLVFLAPLALADAIFAWSSGRSVLDRLFRTVVQSPSQTPDDHRRDPPRRQ